MIKKIQLSILPVIIIITILIVVFGVSMITMSKRLSSLSTQVTSEQRISAALNDSIRYYFNSNNELVAEKLSLQGKYKDYDSKLYINSLILPNDQKISFNWDRSRVGYPVSFSITNSNEYFKVVDLDSYVIPELNKSKIKPNGWQKIGNFFGSSGEKIAVFGFGLGLGALGVFLLVQ